MPTQIYQRKGGGGLEIPMAFELADEYVAIYKEPQLLAAADGILWDPGTNSAYAYSVEFLVVNVHNALVTVSIGHDINSGGALTAAEYWMFSEVIPFPGNSGWRGPFTIDGADDVRGWCATGAAHANVQWRIRRLW